MCWETCNRKWRGIINIKMGRWVGSVPHNNLTQNMIQLSQFCGVMIVQQARITMKAQKTHATHRIRREANKKSTWRKKYERAPKRGLPICTSSIIVGNYHYFISKQLVMQVVR